MQQSSKILQNLTLISSLENIPKVLNTKCYKGTMQQIIKEVLLKYWKLNVLTVKHLLGYDVTNYLVQAEQFYNNKFQQLSMLNQHEIKIQKYILKVYRNCEPQQLKLINAQNGVLQYLSQSQSKKSAKYPKPVQICFNSNQYNSNIQKGLQLGTDKNINCNLQHQSLQIPTPNNKNLFRPNSFILPTYIQANKQVQFVYIRLLQYIPGTMLAQYNQNSQASEPKQLKPQVIENIINQKVPIFIAESLTIPLCHYSTLQLSIDYETIKNRNFSWHLGSFLKNDDYYKYTHNLICKNPNRPTWHSQIIQYFVQVYSSVLDALLNKKQQALRIAIIHNDINQWNIVVDIVQNNPTIKIIDFGDLTNSYVIEDIAIYTLYAIYNQPQEIIVKSIIKIIQNYTKIVPLSQQQLMLYLITVPMRMCLSLCNSQYAMSIKPGQQYVALSQKNGWKLLQFFQYMLKKRSQNLKDQNQINQIFNSEIYQKLKKSATLCHKDSQQFNKLNSKNKPNNQIISQNYSQLGQHWTSEQQFWDNQQISSQKDKHQNPTNQQFQHVIDIFNKYYKNITTNKQIKIKRLPGYITKNYKLTTRTVEGKENHYVMKIYRNIKRLAKYCHIQSLVKNYIMNNQKNQDQIKIYVPKPIIPTQNTNLQFCRVFNDHFWKCEILIRLLTYVDGDSYNHYVQSLQLQKINLNELISQDQQLQPKVSNDQTQNKNLQKIEQFYNIASSIGSMLGRLDKLLAQSYLQIVKQGYQKKQLYTLLKRKDYQWNFCHIHVWQKSIKYISDVKIRRIIQYFIQLFRQNVIIPNSKNTQENKNSGGNKQQSKLLRKSLVHMDPTQDNCLISNIKYNPQVDSIIDFDQIQLAYLIMDLTCVLAHCFHAIPKSNIKIINKYNRINTLHPVYKKSVAKMISSYYRIYKLNFEQIRCLYYFLGVRLGLCITLENRDLQKDPDNTHIGFDLKMLSQYIQSLSLIDPTQFSTNIMKACIENSNEFEQVQNINLEKFDLKMLEQLPVNDCPIHLVHRIIQTAFQQLSKSNKVLFQCQKSYLNENYLLQFEKRIWNYDWISIKLLNKNIIKGGNEVRQFDDIVKSLGIKLQINQNLKLFELMQAIQKQYKNYIIDDK